MLDNHADFTRGVRCLQRQGVEGYLEVGPRLFVESTQTDDSQSSAARRQPEAIPIGIEVCQRADEIGWALADSAPKALPRFAGNSGQNFTPLASGARNED